MFGWRVSLLGLIAIAVLITGSLYSFTNLFDLAAAVLMAYFVHFTMYELWQRSRIAPAYRPLMLKRTSASVLAFAGVGFLFALSINKGDKTAIAFTLLGAVLGLAWKDEFGAFRAGGLGYGLVGGVLAANLWFGWSWLPVLAASVVSGSAGGLIATAIDKYRNPSSRFDEYGEWVQRRNRRLPETGSVLTP